MENVIKSVDLVDGVYVVSLNIPGSPRYAMYGHGLQTIDEEGRTLSMSREEGEARFGENLDLFDNLGNVIALFVGVALVGAPLPSFDDLSGSGITQEDYNTLLNGIVKNEDIAVNIRGQMNPQELEGLNNAIEATKAGIDIFADSSDMSDDIAIEEVLLDIEEEMNAGEEGQRNPANDE